jgi:hypothetical protein
MRYMNICFIEHIYGSLDCGEKKRSPEVAGLLLPTSLFTFVFVGPIVGVLHSLEVQNNEELGILLAVIFTFAAHRLFVSDGQYLSIADKYRNETKENNDNV